MFKLVKYIKNLWWALLLNTGIIVCQAWLQLTLPDYMSKILNTMQNVGLTYDEKMSQIWSCGGIMLAICFGILICAVAIGILNSVIGAIYARNIRNEMFKKIMSFSLFEFNQFGTATLLTRTTNDINTLKDTFTSFCRTVVFSPVMLIVAIIKSVMIDWQMSLVFVVALPILGVTIIVIFFLASPLFSEIQTRLDNVTVVLREGLTGVRVVRAFNQQEQEFAKFTDRNQKMTNTIIKVNRTLSFVGPIINIVFNFTYLAVFFVGFALLDGVLMNESSAETFTNVIVISNYSSNIMMSFLMLGMIFIQLPNANACAKRIQAVLDTKSNIIDPESPIDVSTIKEEDKNTVEFRNVTFTFPDATEPTLKDINFKVKPGQTTAIIGSTGSGKSSIINLIPRFFDTTIGEILVDGVNVKNYSQKDLRDKIGFVPQQARLFTGTIRDNLLFGNPNASEDDLQKALQVSQSAHFVGKKENGIDSFVSQGGKNFSGGQKQRLSIARALVKKPEIYVFDDSFSALDFKTDIRLRTALKSYVGNSSVIVVAQRVSSILDADNIIVLNDGAIAGQGTHDELLLNCPVYQQIVKSQLDKDEIEKTIKMKQQILASKEEEDD